MRWAAKLKTNTNLRIGNVMEITPGDKVQVYLRIIEYKRSIGTMQWTILSIFITASGGVLAFSFSQQGKVVGALIRLLGVVIYFVGYLLYNRYRVMNQQISKYLVELEEENGFRFQKTLDSQFQDKSLSTRGILLGAGCFFLLFSIAISIVR